VECKSLPTLSPSHLANTLFRSATFFFQNGVAGACGTVHKDSDLIAAIGLFHQ
jgi:hypothetical protein